MAKISISNIKKTVYYLKRNGLKPTIDAARERLVEKNKYTYEPTDEQTVEEMVKRVENCGIKFSIIVPAYQTPEDYLREMIESVVNQKYENLELIIADASVDGKVRRIVEAFPDERVKYVPVDENLGISENTNKCLPYVRGDYVGLLDHDDLLTEDALLWMADTIVAAKSKGLELQMIYSDEDKCDETSARFFDLNHKGKFNLDLLLSNNYICHFLVLKAELIKKLGFRKEYDGAQDYDLILRAVNELIDESKKIAYVDRVLYHWRCHSQSTAVNPQSKMYAYDAGLRALQDFADSRGWKAKAMHLKHLGFYTLEYEGDIFDSRNDLQIIGGRVIKHGKVVSGRLKRDGNPNYEGLNVNFSGYMHRAVLSQNAYAVDIRCMKVERKLWEKFAQVTSVVYEEDEQGLFDYTILPEGTDYKALSMKVSRELVKDGGRIVFMPSIERKI